VIESHATSVSGTLFVLIGVVIIVAMAVVGALGYKLRRRRRSSSGRDDDGHTLEKGR
jgi:heme/copper-type cytochrome/quinol oxidase subunit 2